MIPGMKAIQLFAERSAHSFARGSLAIIFIWFGAMSFTSAGAGIVTGWLAGHWFLGAFEAEGGVLAMIIGGLQFAVAFGLMWPRREIRRQAASLLALLSLLALSLMLTNPVWMAELGGFPAIGSGQGIIKYMAILGLALYLRGIEGGRLPGLSAEGVRVYGFGLMLLGLILVLGWIGAMKFTLPEPEGIDDLLKTSIFFAWMTDFLDVREMSKMIGVIELVAAAALTGWWFSGALFRFAIVLCLVTFVSTLSFLITLPGWESDLGGFPALSQAGHFLLKDLALLAAALVLLGERRR